MFQGLALPILLLIFAGAATAVWIAGDKLSDTTDTLSDRFGLGEALGGLILLAIATNLPEIAITGSAALGHSLGIAIGNILGGIAIQTVVLVLLDLFGAGDQTSLTYRVASLVVVLEGVLVVAVLAVVVMGNQLPASLIFARVTPSGVLIALLWVTGLWLIGKARTSLPWQAGDDAPGGQEPDDRSTGEETQEAESKEQSTARVALVFAVAAVVTLVAGVVLEETGTDIAERIHLSGVIFGATILAAVTALPELSTGLASIRLGDYELAFSDIFGGNAFLPVLFLEATLLSGQAALPQAGKTDIYLAGLGMLLTTVYLYGVIFRPRRQCLCLGIDSLVVLVLYLLGIVGLFAVSRGG